MWAGYICSCLKVNLHGLPEQKESHGIKHPNLFICRFSVYGIHQSLLSAAQKRFGEKAICLGIDVDAEAVKNTKDVFSIFHNDAIMPVNVKRKTADYWTTKLPPVNAIIANPPWSTEKIYNRDALINAGFNLVNGQYDSYVLFIELAYNILSPGGTMAFIIPDSLFDATIPACLIFFSHPLHSAGH